MTLHESDLLDPRPGGSTAGAGLACAVAIPADELAERVYELPPTTGALRVLDYPPHGEEALCVLRGLGREGTLVTPVTPAEAGARGSATEGVRGSAIEGARVARYRLWRPSGWLAEVAGHLKPGAALDLGCGAGRDAVFLAERGWRVTGVDRLPDALERGEALRRRYAPEAEIVWQALELLKADWPWESQRFELVCAVRFYHADLLARMARIVAPGGSLVLEAFHPGYAAATGRRADSRRTLLSDAEALAAALPGFEVVAVEAEPIDQPRLTRVWARRGSNTSP